MEKKLGLGNFAVARGAYEAGVKVATAYPGTPSTEILEFVSEYSEIDAEWAVNEKVALEVGIGASFAGARSLVAMKHVGLNVAADPLFTVAYTGVNGGLVIVVADDPGMHSSQNEQDSRYYALFSKVIMLEPSDSEEARVFTKRAFELSEQFDLPVILRLTTRIAHSQGFINFDARDEIPLRDYKKDIAKNVMIPAYARGRHTDLERRLALVKNASLGLDYIKNGSKLGIVCSGVIYQYVLEALPDASIYKVGQINPLNISAISEFAKTMERLVVIEELEPYIQTQLSSAGIQCEGKNLFSVEGELSAKAIRQAFNDTTIALNAANSLMPRPPVLCAGCPHRGVFYVLNRLGVNITGDICCYSLGALPPLNAMDTLVCMGASVGMAVGYEKARGKEFGKKTVAVIGDSTFIHSGITGLINAVYNKTNTKILIMDNSTTGMTGHQSHPASGKNIKGNPTTNALDLEKLSKACGADSVKIVDAYDIKKVEQVLIEELSTDGVSVIIAKRACALLKDIPKKQSLHINNKCVNCQMCLRLGCPAIGLTDKKVTINKNVCRGCAVCKVVCKVGAIE